MAYRGSIGILRKCRLRGKSGRNSEQTAGPSTAPFAMKLRGPFDYAQVRMTHLLKKSDMSSLETFPRLLKPRTRPPQRQNATADPCGMTTKEQTTKSEGAALVGQKSRWRSRFLHYAAHKGVSSFGRNDTVFYVRGKNMLVALRCRNDKVFYV